ncbi:hypothetical protein AB0H77_21975 [Streptomyces sp. NPDC050844]|uniref:hypothetical protein n=1 Tax=Streptomyces sp. NPDC050844 TaxID=3155790 RepID=UPI0033C43B59
MVFPQTALPLKVELKVGSTWTDITGDVRGADQIRIIRGRSDEGQQVDTSRCTFTLDNNNGKYSPRNPSGAYYGSIGRNTPVRVSVMTGAVYLDLPGAEGDFASTPDTAALDITGDLDIRIDATLANWLPPAASGVTETVELIGKFNSGQKSWLVGMRDGRLYVEWSADGSTSLSASSTVAPVIPGGGGRLAIRVTLDVNNGASGNTVRFYTAEHLNAPWTQLGDPVTQSGVTSIFNSTAPLRIGNASNFLFRLPIGRCHAAEVRNGLWGTVVANPDFTAQSVGASSFADGAGLTWTMNGQAAITNRKTRFAGEISAWPVRWETRHDVTVPVEASGIMRRLSQGASPVRSAMYRELTNPARTGIVAYWPMEDGASATSLASAFDGHQGMTISASGVTRAGYAEWVASDAITTFETGRVRARVASHAGGTSIFVRFFAAVPPGGVSSTNRLFSISGSGTARLWSLYVNTSGSIALRAYDNDGVQVLDTGFGTFDVNGKQRHIGIELTQNGANVDYRLIVFRLDETTLSAIVSSSLSGTLNAHTIGTAAEVRVGEDGGLNGTAVGHIAIGNSTAFVNTQGAMIAWREELASARIYRLGAEDRIASYSAGDSDQEIGTQGLLTLLDLMREAEAADGGILAEQRDFLGLRYRDRISLYNQQPAMTLAYPGDDGLVTPLEPVDDDQQVRNDVTVARTGGSSTRVTLDTGTLSTQAPPTGVGRYPDSVTLNLSDDDQTLPHAGWRLHLGTWDETRYPVVRINLAAAPHMIEDATAVDIGDRFHITDPPSWLPPDTIDLMAQGSTEVLDQFTWTLDFNCSPAGPWDVAWAGDRGTATSRREFAWADTDGSQLAEALDTSETAVDVHTTSGLTWTSDAEHSPYDLRVGGEVMTVTAPSTLLNSNPFFDTDATGWTAVNATITPSTTFVMPHPRARRSLRIAPNGSSATGGATCAITAAGTITPGGVYTLSGWVFSVNGWSDLQVCVDWHDAAGTFISTSTGAGQSASASVWTYLEQELTAPAGASRAGVRLRHGGTPAASDVWYVWAARITRPLAGVAFDGFNRTSASTWGTADCGTAWTESSGSASDRSCNGTKGVITLAAAVDTVRRQIIAPAVGDCEILVSISPGQVSTGSSLVPGILFRHTDASTFYRLRLHFRTDNTVYLVVTRGSTEQGAQVITGLTYAANSVFWLRGRVVGDTVYGRVWRDGDVEPPVWQIERTITTSPIATGDIGLTCSALTGFTNVNATTAFDRFEVITPQTFTVVRSQNGVSKAHALGADVRLANPAIVAL